MGPSACVWNRGIASTTFMVLPLTRPTKIPITASEECLELCINAFAYACGWKAYAAIVDPAPLLLPTGGIAATNKNRLKI
mmetsp:Transcript_26503/g.69133  ORF Transcript_26503/g.69133 Transcript_26503/m.69133 type:complete len:80 (-) Transcript_26503:11-250(-)